MKYPRTHGPRTQAKWKLRKQKPKEIYPFELVEKEVHGQMVCVKVYKPAWAQGDKREFERLGLIDPPDNRFARDRAAALERKAKKPKKPPL
jgi:hypothetical protein